MYSLENNVYTLLGTQNISHIENESNTDYENRAVYVCKDICQDYINTDIYKQNKKNITHVKAILTNPWSIYEIINLEKKLDKPEKIDQRFIDKLIIHKESDNLSILKNDIFNLSLNGYSVSKVNGQISDTVNIQYLSIHTSSNFLNRLTNALETIFHIHEVEIESIYSYVDSQDGLRIVIEDQIIDLSYVYQNKIISTLCIPCGCISVKNKIKENLHIDNIILDKILKSKSLSLSTEKLSFNNDKSLNNIWPDLDQDIKNKIDEQLEKSLSFIKEQIRTFIENIENEFVTKDIKIFIYTLDDNILFSAGFILAFAIKGDAYILDKLLTNESNIFTKKIF